MPFARRKDRVTSHEAAESVRNLKGTQRAIYTLLSVNPSTDEKLIEDFKEFANMGAIAMASDSGIRSRRAELVAEGLVKPIGFDKTRSGRRTIVWGIA